MPERPEVLKAAEGTEAGAIAEITRLSAIPCVHDDPARNVISVIIPDGAHFEITDLERHRDRPRTGRGTIALHTPEGLIGYTSRHVDKTHSTLWADVDNARITVILNDHGNDGIPAWADHRAALTLQRSPEWKAWTLLNERQVGQVELAEFLEEHVSDVLDPDGATMLEVARSFHATSGARFRQAHALHSGEQQLVYEEQIEAKAGPSGDMTVPREFVVRLRPFVGNDPVEISGRFNFRIREGRLTLGYRLLNLDDHTRTAVDAIVAGVAKALELEAIHGTAPEARR